MLHYIKKYINKHPNLKFFLKSPLNWIYASYLTFRFVDEWGTFPAFQINGSIKVKLQKHKNAKLIIKKKLILERWLNGHGHVSIIIGDGAKCLVENDFLLGQGVKIYLGSKAQLVLKGKEIESASGITANSVLMVNEYLEIGKDCIIAWDTFITDCDWHGIEGKVATKRTKIGDHTWVGVGAKVLKGAIINKNSIITSQSVVLDGNYQENVMIGGSPAKILKTNIPRWRREMF